MRNDNFSFYYVQRLNTKRGIYHFSSSGLIGGFLDMTLPWLPAFFRTHRGISLSTTKSGSPKNCHAPMVLRVADSESHHLVGECYLHGQMHSEMLDSIHRGVRRNRNSTALRPFGSLPYILDVR